jgi:2,4-dienoyl-CoA reductase-like NADH-dependent reductase (Old Yellow Enzyme family)
MATSEPLLIDAIDQFIQRHSMSPVTFGRSALRDPHFVRDLRGGRRVWPETEDKVREFMSSYTEQVAA